MMKWSPANTNVDVLHARRLKRAILFLSLMLVTICAMSAACQQYVSPPTASLSGLNQGILSDPAAPLVLQFSKPIDFSTLRVKVIKFDPNAQGQLPDETGDPTVSLDPLFSHDDIDGDKGGVATLDPDRKSTRLNSSH